MRTGVTSMRPVPIACKSTWIHGLVPFEDEVRQDQQLLKVCKRQRFAAEGDQVFDQLVCWVRREIHSVFKREKSPVLLCLST